MDKRLLSVHAESITRSGIGYPQALILYAIVLWPG